MEIKGSILVVDDEESIRMLLEKALEVEGYEVTVASDHATAVAHLKKRRFDLALIDKNLPDQDGLEVLSEAKRIDPEIECIIITGYATLDSAIEAIRYGAFDYVTKPFDHIKNVIDRVHKAVERHRKRDSLKDLLMNLDDSKKELAGAMDGLKSIFPGKGESSSGADPEAVNALLDGADEGVGEE